MRNYYHAIAAVLGIAFVILKLCHVIDWSWWWVTLPFWAWIVVALFAIGIIVAIKMICALFSHHNRFF